MNEYQPCNISYTYQSVASSSRIPLHVSLQIATIMQMQCPLNVVNSSLYLHSHDPFSHTKYTHLPVVFWIFSHVSLTNYLISIFAGAFQRAACKWKDMSAFASMLAERASRAAYSGALRFIIDPLCLRRIR